MGKKNRTKKKIQLYTAQERKDKISTILMQIATMELSNIITKDVKKLLQNWIDTGETTEKDIPLAQYGRTMLIRLYNDKKANTFINLKHNKVNVKDNRLNRMQDMTEEGKIYDEHVMELEKEKKNRLNEMEKILENGSVEELLKLQKTLEEYK